MTSDARIPVSTAEGYARWAKRYDGYRNPLILAEEAHVREMLGDVRGKRVLDAGCGTGRHAVWLRAAGARVVGVDASEEMLAVARAKDSALELRCIGYDDLDALERDFDVVLSALVLEHLPDVRPAVAALARRLGPGGALVISVYHTSFMLKGVPPHFADDDGRAYEMPGHAHFASDYVNAIVASGLALSEMREPRVDDAMIERMPHMEKHRGLPIAYVFRATRPG
jgi:2-polyprenyl-3-methyl-5-hydroxy-6-metoxy-1,4-benzoquinol methylase